MASAGVAMSFLFVPLLLAGGCREEPPTTPSTSVVADPRCPDPVEICATGCVLDVDLRTHTLSGSLLYDGAPLAATGPSDWQLRFVDSAGRSTSVQLPGGSTYAAPVLPGTYDVFFELLVDAAAADPAAGEVRVAEGLVIDGDRTLDLAIEAVTLSGGLSWQGSPLLATSESDWQLLLTETGSGVQRAIDLPGGATYAARVYAGTYDLAAAILEEASVDPDLFGAIPLARGEVLSADAAFDVAIELVRVSGPLLVDGAPAAETGAVRTLLFREVNDGGALYASVAEGPAWEAWVPPGTYDVVLSLGAGPYTAAEDVVVDAGGATFPLSLEFPATVELSGSVTYDGAPIPKVGDDEIWSLLLIRTSDPTGFGERRDFPGGPTYSASFTADTYDVYFTLPGDVPMDRPVDGLFPVATSYTLAGDSVLDVDVPVGTLRGTASLPGDGANPDGPYEVDLELTEPTSGHVEALTVYTGDPFELAVFQGPLDIAASAYTSELATPVDGLRPVGRVTVGDEATFDFAVEVAVVSGEVRWDGTAPAEDRSWRLVFTDPTTGETHAASFAGGSYAAAMFPGIWDVGVEWLEAGTFPTQVDGVVPVASCVRVQ